jgi:inositol-phosphate transport system permease protein
VSCVPFSIFGIQLSSTFTFLFLEEANMSSTSQGMTAVLPSEKSYIAGHIVVFVGAIMAIICFFLPWIAFVKDGNIVASLSGVQISAGPIVEMSGGVVVFRGSPISYMAPVIGVIVLGLSGYAYLIRKYVKAWDGFLKIGLSVITAIILWSQMSQAIRAVNKVGGVEMDLLYGLTGVFLALLLISVAGILDIRNVMRYKPSFANTLSALNFMSFATFLVTIFFLIPVVILFVLSLTDLASSNFSEPWNFIGLENYRRMFNDAFFPKILGNTIFYVVMTLVFFNVGLALLLALLTAHINRRASFFFRLLWLLPRITPSVVYIVMWQRIAQPPPYGILNQFLGLLGVEKQPYWINEAPWLFVIMANGFVGASFGLIIFSSAIEAIPKDLMVAAKVDGASAWQIIRDITLPLMRWPLLFVTTYQTLSLLVSFEYILLLTNGGPGLFTTEVWALTAYKRALGTYFGSNQWGYGAAWGFVLVVIGAVLSIVYLRMFRFNDLVQEPRIDVL